MKEDPCHACYDARVVAFWMLPDYRVQLQFEDGLVGDVDLSDLPGKGGIYAPLADREFFYTEARVDWLTLCWPGEIDLDPCSLYHEARDHMLSPPRRKHWWQQLARALAH